jgi:hypothetical protein
MRYWEVLEWLSGLVASQEVLSSTELVIESVIN